MGGIVTKRIAFAIKVLLPGRKAFSKSHYSDSAVSGFGGVQILVGIFRSTISGCRVGDVEWDLIGLTQGTIACVSVDRPCPFDPALGVDRGVLHFPGIFRVEI
jgi:hypothetical protein